MQFARDRKNEKHVWRYTFQQYVVKFSRRRAETLGLKLSGKKKTKLPAKRRKCIKSRNAKNLSNLHGRPRKNNHPFGIYENIKLGLINYTLLGLIEHHGVFIDSGHYVSYIRQSNKWYHCDDKHITETNLLTLSNNVYLMFYAKEVDLGT